MGKVANRCRCGHHLLRHRSTGITCCPSCDLIVSWPRTVKGTWTPV